MLNKVILIGRFGRDHEVRYMPNTHRLNNRADKYRWHRQPLLKTSTTTSRFELRSKE